tara:strand:+ start:915 stop:1622 length:708 start_codon:yes stop_codon:yes gene_type:complete
MLIKINDLNIQYGNKKVLQNFNLLLAEREIVTIVGPNGSGKTTLFKAIIGTAPIKTGTVELKPNLKIGYVPQQLNIDRSLPLTVDRFLRLTQNKFKNTLKIVNIEDILNHQLSNLSSGQIQRVLLASAILNRPDVLLLDEATRGLDQPGTAAFYRLVETIRKETGCAILMISHDLHVVMAASDRVICLNTHICCEGAPQAVARSPEYKALFGPDIDGAFALYQHSHSVKKENEKV